MPRINITENSDTYSYQTRPDAFGVIATPICAIWGPTYDATDEDNNPDWQYFQAGFKGTTEFVQTFRGPNKTLGVREKSYDYVLKLLAAGYDVLVKRCDGFGRRSNYTLYKNDEGTKPSIAEAAYLSNPPALFGYSSTGIKVKVTGKTELGGSLNGLYMTFERTTPIPKDWKKSTRVTGNILIYHQDNRNGDNRTLLEKIPVVFTQPAPTIENNEGITSDQTVKFAPVTVSITNSAYINQAIFEGISVLPAPTTENLSGVFSGGSATTELKLKFKAKYPGSYGNQLKVRIKSDVDSVGNPIAQIEIFDRNGFYTNSDAVMTTDSLLEQIPVALSEQGATDNRPYITEAVSEYLGYVTTTGKVSLIISPGSTIVFSMYGGTDSPTVDDTNTAEGYIPASEIELDNILNLAKTRFYTETSAYLSYIKNIYSSLTQPEKIQLWSFQKCMLNVMGMTPELTDPFVYDWDAVFCGIQDDQYIPKSYIDERAEKQIETDVEFEVTRIHYLLFEVASQSKCGAAIVGTPFGMKRGTWDPLTKYGTGAVAFKNSLSITLGSVLSTFGELVGPWCRSTLPFNGKNTWVCPELAHLLLIISKKTDDGVRYWWLPPAGMNGSGIVYSPEYKIKKHYLDIIQNHDEGVCLNPLMNVPGKGFTCFGNSTLWDKPLGTYNALQNLSTRFLCNRVKQCIWNAALEILFRYNNNEAYTHFYALLSPLLDTMRSVGALNSTPKNPLGYRIVMNPDIINLDHINANTVIGRVELAVQGVIDTVNVDLFLLPPNYFEEEGNM